MATKKNTSSGTQIGMKPSKTNQSSPNQSLPMTNSMLKPSGTCCNNSSITSTSSDTKETAGAKKGPRTRIVVRYDIGFNNALTLRGKGADLSWDKGVALKNIKNDEWIWETDKAFNTCEFKVLINDQQYEIGENHALGCGSSIQYTPQF